MFHVVCLCGMILFGVIQNFIRNMLSKFDTIKLSCNMKYPLGFRVFYASRRSKCTLHLNILNELNYQLINIVSTIFHFMQTFSRNLQHEWELWTKKLCKVSFFTFKVKLQLSLQSFMQMSSVQGCVGSWLHVKVKQQLLHYLVFEYLDLPWISNL